MNTILSDPAHGDAPIDEATVRQLMAGGENLHVEFKGDGLKHNSASGVSDDDVVEAVVCLANKGDGTPGWLLVGVEDSGVHSSSEHWGQGKSPGRITALIENRTEPAARVEVRQQPIDGHTVTAIKVFPASLPTCTSAGLYVRRTFAADGTPTGLPLRFTEMQSLRAAAGELDFAELIAEGVEFADLDKVQFERYRKRIVKHEGRADQSLLDKSDEDLCRSLKAVEYDSGQAKVRMLGLLLFGREEMIEDLIPTHRVAYQIASRHGVHWNEIRPWPLIEAMDELENMLARTEHEDEIVFGTQRVGLPEYSPFAVREGVANALIHRDYFIRQKVQVRWLGDRLDIFSPGGFPHGISQTTFLVNGSKPRNPLLLSAFKRCGIVEEIGRGIRTIFEKQLIKGRSSPTYRADAMSQVSLGFHRHAVDLRMVRLARHEDLHSDESPLDMLLILDEIFRRKKIDASRTAELTQLDAAKAMKVLERMEQRGILHQLDRDPAVWQLSARANRICGKPLPLESSSLSTEEPRRRRKSDDDSIYKEQIHDYLSIHQRITRRDVVELCAVDEIEATKLLARLTKSGELARHGKTRHAWYGLPHVE